MNQDSLDHLVSMANQIADNLRPGAASDDAAAEKTASHIKRFWARSMKQQLKDYVETDGSALSAIAAQAIRSL